MPAAEHKAIVRRVFDEWFNGGNAAVADETYGPNYVHHDPSLPPELQRGRDNYKQVLAGFHAAFPDFRMTIDDMLAEGDKVAVRWSFQGTQRGELMGIPPTAKQVSITGTEILRFADGKIVEGWNNFDALGMMQQLGVVPAARQAGG